ncbi:DUF6611 family protein [Curtobacterium sp. MCLR17_054]|uniref:DUF6611 family protein n=1 Tax=Curtobacterium sp. MCLR17_054 TaxID=2175632 RepID=UPI000DA8A9D4|nr:DUF6611 family protein [Curtobacterium sp. MCLR17_054]WIE68578.1 hypothetical protein DEJ08_001055 [Curtobacterium sp. MCLR17_054]
MTVELPVRTRLLDGTHLWGRYTIRPVGRTLWSSRTLVVFPPGTTTGERLLLRAWHVWPAVGAVVALAALVLAVSVPAVGTTTALLVYGGGFAVLARATRSLRPRVRSVTVTTFLGDGRREVHGDERLLTGSLDALSILEQALRADRIRPVDFELIWGDVWNALESPDPDHRVQRSS